MKVFWREHRSGQRMILDTGEEELEIGAFRRTPRGYDALAKTLGYDPGRAQKGFPTPANDSTASAGSPAKSSSGYSSILARGRTW